MSILSPKATMGANLAVTDWSWGFARVMMDEVFGVDNYKNEIAWCYSGPSNTISHMPRKHDSILFYVKGMRAFFDRTF